MRVLRLVPILVLFLLLSGGQSMQIERAYAACCPIPRCPCCWSYMIYGSITMLENGKASISTGKASTTVVDVSQRIQDAFKEEKITQDFGFIVLDGDMSQQQAQVVAFVAADRNKHNPSVNDKGSAQSVVNFYNQAFEKFLKEQSSAKPSSP